MSDEGFTTRPEISGTFGMVAASHWLAAQSGMAMLERGGNAFDAAVAAGFVLQVVEPHQNGLGGEAPMIVYVAASDAVHVVAGQGPAPSTATSAAFGDLGLSLVPGTGLTAACVPAAFGSWMLVLERYGTMTLAQVLEPAISYAENGFPVLPLLASLLRALAPAMTRDWPSSAAIWLADGVPPPGGRLRNPLLASTYRRLAASAGGAKGVDGAIQAFYEGEIAEAIDSFCRIPAADADGVHSGFLRGEDLAKWRPSTEPAVSFDYGDFEVFKTGPWGQGPVMLQQLALLSGFDLASMGAGSAELVHVVTECAKLAFADREAWYGDPSFVDVPLATLLSAGYNTERRALVGPEASLDLRAGSPGGALPRLPRIVEPMTGGGGDGPDPRLGPPGGDYREMRGDTCHLDVVDRFGNFVSATPSGGWLQASPAVPGLGFCLGTRAQMFWLEAGLPDSLVPGKRPRTTLSPSLVKRSGVPYLAFGTPGGDQQDQWTLLFFLYHAEFGYDLQAAIDAANWHSTHFPSSFHPRESSPGELVAEAGLGRAVLDDLTSRGHKVVEAGEWSLGRVTAVSAGRGGLLRAAADPRAMQAYAVGR